MHSHIFYTAGCTKALYDAAAILQEKGCHFATQPETTVTHLLLDVPSFNPDGTLKSGAQVKDILKQLNSGVTLIGGNLLGPSLDGYRIIDLLQNPDYTAENADITAHCAVKIAMQKLPITLKHCHILVIGWGRIGKCLASLLRSMGAYVTVAARKSADRAMLSALGYDTVNTASIGYELLRYRVIFNTVPEKILSKETVQYCGKDCLKIDLASVPGIDAEDVIWARGLPNKDAPETSGSLIAKTILRLI